MLYFRGVKCVAANPMEDPQQPNPKHRPLVPRPQGRPKDADKAAAVLAAARARFLRDGYRRTSLDAIAADAGVSKVTVYSHFDDKESLFVAVMRDHARRMGWRCGDEDYDDPKPPRTRRALRLALVRMGVALLMFLARPELSDAERAMMTEAKHSKTLGQRFWEFGPQRAIDDLSDLLRQGEAAGLIRLRHRGRGPNVAEAAERLIGMWKGLDDTRVLFSLPRRAGDHKALYRHIGECTDDFLRARTPD